MAVDFKGTHFPKSVILHAVFFYVRYPVSYRNLQEILAGLHAVNTILKFTGAGAMIEIRQIEYLNNILEQDHRFIKRITKQMMGFKASIPHQPPLQASKWLT